MIVTRWQMALFLHRLAVADGISLVSAAGHNDFNDLEGLGNEALSAINSLSDIHVVLGTAIDAFSPQQHVLRWQMALFLARLLAAAAPGVTITSSIGTNLGASAPGILSPSDQIFIQFSGVVTLAGGASIDLVDSDGTTATCPNLQCNFLGEHPALTGRIVTISGP